MGAGLRKNFGAKTTFWASVRQKFSKRENRQANNGGTWVGEQKLEENPRLCPPETVTYLHKFWVCYPSVFNLKAVRKNARGKRRGSVENFLSNKLEVFLHFFFFAFISRWVRKISKDATWKSDGRDSVQSWNHENYLAEKFCFVFFLTFYSFHPDKICEMSSLHKLFVIMHLWKCFHFITCRRNLFIHRVCFCLPAKIC